MRPGILAIAVLIGSVLTPIIGADLNGRWYWSSPQPPLLGWKEVAFGNGTFLATAMSEEAHLLYSSADGIQWQEVLVPSSTIYHLDFVNDRFLGCSREGILSSLEGKTWRLSTVPNPWRSAFAYGNGNYVAVGGSRNVAVSTDGVHWEEHALPQLEPGSEINGIAFGNGRFVALGIHGTLLTSEDGKDWTHHPWLQGLPVVDYARAALIFHKGRFIYANYHSTDGIQWERQASGGGSTGNIRVGAAGKLMNANGNVMVSEDGVNWEMVYPRTSYQWFSSVAFGNNCYVAVGDKGLMARSEGEGNWQMVRGSYSNRGDKVVFGEGKFLRYGGTNVYWSLDAKHWEEQVTPENFQQVVYGNGKFLARGASWNLYRFEDGEWVAVRGALPGSLYFGGDLFMTTQTNGTLLFSADTENWREIKVMDRPFTVAFGNGRYLAMGYQNVYSSIDAVNWERIADGPLYGFRLTFGNGRFLFSGMGGMGPPSLSRSEDGREWEEYRGGTSHLFDGFGFDAGYFYMLDWAGAVHFSRDGLKWEYNRLTRDGLRSLAVGNGMMVITGGSDVVLRKLQEERPVKWLPLEMALAGEKLKLSGSAGSEPVQIERSTNLIEWQPVVTVNQRDTSYDVELGASLEAGFFRAREVELEFLE